MTHGAPISLAMQAERQAEQEALLMTVRQFEREAGRLVNELESRQVLNRQALYAGESMLAAAILLLKRAVGQEKLFP